MDSEALKEIVTNLSDEKTKRAFAVLADAIGLLDHKIGRLEEAVSQVGEARTKGIGNGGGFTIG